MQFRDERISSQIRDELSTAILREIELPGAIMTITEVELTQKRDAATVYISVMPEAKEQKVLKILIGAQGMLRHRLLKRLKIKVIPDLYFKLDNGPKNAAMVEKVLINQPLPDEETEN